MTTPHVAATATRIRSLSDEALCTLLDCARWADEAGHFPEIAQDDETYTAIGEVLAEVEDGLL